MGNAIVLTLPGPWRIPIQIDASILALAVLFMALSASGGGSVADGAIFLGILILSILLHELGHAFACVVQGIPVTRIVLHGGGGFCQHSARVTHKQSEFIVICGPLVNLALWAVANLLMQLDFASTQTTILLNGAEVKVPIGNPAHAFLTDLAMINLFLGLFNLLPVLPLDGGRLLHSVLHRFVKPRQANRITGAVGVVMAVLWLPLIFLAIAYLGFILLFFPPFRLHWRMMRSGQG